MFYYSTIQDSHGLLGGVLLLEVSIQILGNPQRSLKTKGILIPILGEFQQDIVRSVEPGHNHTKVWTLIRVRVPVVHVRIQGLLVE